MIGIREPHRRPFSKPLRAARLVWLAAVLTVTACGEPERPPTPQPVHPNILWIVWDTVRADHLGLYGYRRPTTPHLEAWAKGARVYDDCVAAAPYTVPSHASMFTGLLPTEHGASNLHPYLDDRYATLAELLRDSGYQTYLFSANPHISRAENFHRGFDVEEHPWDARYRSEALRIVAGKIAPEDRSSELPDKIRAGKPERSWDIKACGELAQRGAEAWLKRRDPRRPFFVFLNYMEAHRPWIPAEAYRRIMMTSDQIGRSYQVDRSWLPLWKYTFRLHEYTADEIDLMAATYDACLAELDDLFHRMIVSLEAKGLLENTVVVLTSDHGEHLGERHILDHQYSLYEPVLRVPLVLRGGKTILPGRDPRPVMLQDLFPTLLEIAGVEVPPGRHAVSLLAPAGDRVRVAEYLGAFRDAFPAVEARNPGWDPTPWEREIRALYRGGDKLILWSDGHRELYALRDDAEERTDLANKETRKARRMEDALAALVGGLEPAVLAGRASPTISAEQRERLRALGYLDEGTSEASGGAGTKGPGGEGKRP